jgi:hypothetical protein
MSQQNYSEEQFQELRAVLEEATYPRQDINLNDVRGLLEDYDAAMERIRTLEAQRDAAWNAAIEAAANVCEAERVEVASIDSDGAYNLATEHCAAAIRALKRAQK